MDEQRWVFVVKVLDKPGALTAAASIFSNRGISLEAILGSGISAATTADGRLVLSFQATERKKEMLQRALERLAKVVQVQAYLYDDPQLRAIAIAKVAATASLDLSSESVRSETISHASDGQTLLLTGGTLAVDRVVEQLRQQQVLLDLVISAIAL